MTEEFRTVFSEDRQYRYELWREWDNSPLFTPNQIKRQFEYPLFIGLNPSTADEVKDDATVRKCIGFAKRWLYGGLCIMNLFAFRTRHPKVMMGEKDPVGEENLERLVQAAQSAGIVIAAWGANGGFLGQDRIAFQFLSNAGLQVHCLRKTKHGHPELPLYVPYDVEPVPFAF